MTFSSLAQATAVPRGDTSQSTPSAHHSVPDLADLVARERVHGKCPWESHLVGQIVPRISHNPLMVTIEQRIFSLHSAVLITVF